MENTGLKGLAVTLWQRVVLSYKTTLLGIAVVGVGAVIDNLVASPNHTVAIVGGVLGSIFALVKEKLPAPPPALVVPPPEKPKA